MSFLDGQVNGPFDRMFDLDNDGRLDIGEQALQLEFLDEDWRREQRELDGDYTEDDSSDDDL